MWSTIFGFVLFVSCVFAESQGLRRIPRSSGASSSSYSSSSSSSSSGGSGLNQGGYFHFPTPMPYFPYQNPSALAFPMFDFNQMFNQFLRTAQAAHGYAAQNPTYAKIFEEQMKTLAALQQMALVQYPFAFPGFESNSITPDNYGGGAGGWAGAPAGGYGTGGSASHGGSSSGSFSGGYGSGGSLGGGYGSVPVSGYGAGGSSGGGYGSLPAGGYRTGGTVKTGSDPAVFTSGSVSVGPGGGHGTASSYPGGPDGLGVRISEDYPAPSGGPIGTFSSSASGVSSINGKTTSFKTSTVGVNDNGKITFRTVNE